jgi:hypothetical protein
MSEGEDGFSNLYFLIQYRRKDDGVRWINMAAFDVRGPAEKYFAEQSRDEEWPWEYRFFDLENNTCIQQSTDHQP